MCAAIIAAVVALIGWIVDFCKSSASVAYDAVSAVGSGLVDGAVDWWNDPDTTMAEKLAAVTAAGYIIAPKTTSNIISRVAEGTTDIVKNTVKTVTDSIASVWSTTWGKVVICGAAFWLFTRGGSNNA